MRRLITLAGCCALLVALAVPASSVAGQPVVNDHANFTSDPYPDNWCGIDGTSVDTVHDQFKQDATGATIENFNVKTLFTASASGKSMTIQSSGSGKTSAPIDNGDGTYTLITRNAGLTPKFSFPNGPPIVIDVGLVGFAVTFDSNDNFIGFEVLYQHGQRPPGCDAIIAALS